MKEALRVQGLCKRYGGKEVLQGVDLQVPAGTIHALLGVNGAGKTTTLECIEGLRAFDSGEILVEGRIGIQLQSASLPAHIRGGEAVQLFSRWNSRSADHAMLATLGVDQLARKQYQAMSTGQQRRLHLALALIGDPDVLFLDEPTAGLDVEGRAALHGYIRRLKRRGKTILLASHDMTEVETLCDGIAILRDGRIAFSGTPQELTAVMGTQYNVRVSTASGTQTYQAADAAESLIAILEDYRKRGIAVQDIEVNRGTLEQHFLQFSAEVNG